jgi:hypothetical protein
LTVLSVLLPTLLQVHRLVVSMCRCLYHYRCLLEQEVLVYALLVASMVAEEASSCQLQHHWLSAVQEALSVPALAEVVEVLV